MPTTDLACRELVELVTGYLEGSLSAGQLARVERHLAGCGNCSAYLEQVRVVIGLTPHPPQAPDALVEQIMTIVHRRRL